MAPKPSTRRRRAPRPRIVLRWLALAVTIVCAFLYYRPLQTYLHKREALAERQAEVAALRAEHRRLERRVAASGRPGVLLLEARRLGLVKPGERLFIVKGIPEWRRRYLRERAARVEGDG